MEGFALRVAILDEYQIRYKPRRQPSRYIWNQNGPRPGIIQGRIQKIQKKGDWDTFPIAI